MHTFFINTSKDDLKKYDVLFDIHVENRALVVLDCLMTEWYDTNKGYLECVRKMGDMIDAYSDMNNTFNLILYIDLNDYPQYAMIERNKFNEAERRSCLNAMHILFKHVITNTIMNELIAAGRKPNSLLILFGEDKDFEDQKTVPAETIDRKTKEKLFEFLGLPGKEAVEDIAKKVDAGTPEGERIDVLKDRISAACGKELIDGIRGSYDDKLNIWYEEIISLKDVEEANKALFAGIKEICTAETERIGIKSVACPYDVLACRANRSAITMKQINIALYLLECVETNSIYVSGRDETERKVRTFVQRNPHRIAQILNAKMRLFSKKSEEADEAGKSYQEMKLAPQLKSLDCGKFGLDEFGGEAWKLVIVDAEDTPEKSEDQAGKENEDKEKDKDKDKNSGPIKGRRKEVIRVKKEDRRVFAPEEFKSFDGSGAMIEKKIRSGAKPEEYKKSALELREYHLKYLNRLQEYVSDALSNYAGRSRENKPAVLQRGKKRYTNDQNEEKVLDSVEKIAETAYDTVLNRYVQFCAGRDVAITDIEAQCNWFVTRIDQITESLNRIKKVIIGLLIALIAVYLPYLIIQRNAITKDLPSILTAVGSFGIPVVLLGVVFFFVRKAQKRKYQKAWKEFTEKSNEAISKNADAAHDYEMLLATVTPSLRYVYEYKNDVEFYARCCAMAKAKIKYHKNKLDARVNDLRIIIGDLEVLEEELEDVEEIAQTEDIDYNYPFCKERNSSFYAVIEMKNLQKREGA